MDTNLEAYVRAALRLQGYVFDEARIADVVRHFAHFDATARAFTETALPHTLEPATVFRP